MSGNGDYGVTVCAACLRAACWHGEEMCEKARSASTTVMAASELRKLGYEHPDRYSVAKLIAVTGTHPRGIR